MTDVMVVDDLRLMRKGLVRMIESDAELHATCQSADGDEAVKTLRTLKAGGRPLPQVILMDVRMPVMDGITATAIVSKEFPGIHVLILATYDEDDYAFAGLHAGAYGFLLKDVSARDLQNAIHAVCSGDAVLIPRITAKLIDRDRNRHHLRQDDPQAKAMLGRLTPREYEIAGLMAQGLSNSETAGRLTIEAASVRRTASRILDKTGLRDRTQVVIAWFQAGGEF